MENEPLFSIFRSRFARASLALRSRYARASRCQSLRTCIFRDAKRERSASEKSRKKNREMRELAVFFAGARPTRLSHLAKVVPPRWDEAAKILLSPFSEDACARGPFRERRQSLRLGAFRGRGKKVTVSEIFGLFCLVFFGFSLLFRFASLLDG